MLCLEVTKLKAEVEEFKVANLRTVMEGTSAQNARLAAAHEQAHREIEQLRSWRAQLR